MAHKKMDNLTPVVSITGASSGIGAELAKQYSKRNINLILSARRAEVLFKFKESSKGGGLKLKYFLLI